MTWFFGWGTLINMLIAVITAELAEASILAIRQKPIKPAISDLSAVLTAVLLALSIPAFTLAENLRKQVMKLNIAHTAAIGSNIVTISVGVASVVPNLDSTSAELISQADQALYESKGKGRNRVTIAA